MSSLLKKSTCNKIKNKLLQELINSLNNLPYDVVFTIIYSYIEPYNTEFFSRNITCTLDLNLIDISGEEMYILSNITRNIIVINKNDSSNNIIKNISLGAYFYSNKWQYMFIYNNKILLICKTVILFLSVNNSGEIIDQKYAHIEYPGTDVIKHSNMIYILHTPRRCIIIYDQIKEKFVGRIDLDKVIDTTLSKIAINDNFIIMYNYFESKIKILIRDSFLTVLPHSTPRLTKDNSKMLHYAWIFTPYYLHWNSYIILTNDEIFIMDSDDKSIRVYDLYTREYKRIFGDNKLDYLSPIKIINDEIFVRDINGKLSVWKRKFSYN
jgi:hypothetical protein